MQRTYVHTSSPRGAVVVVTAVLLVVLLVFAGLAIDAGYLYVTRVELQRTTDAAALAAASHVDWGGDLTEMTRIANRPAQEFALRNPAARQAVKFDPASDVELGVFDRYKRVFYPGANPINAIRVTARRSESSPNGPLPLFLMGILGHDTAEVAASSTVMLKPNCQTLGIRAMEVVIAANSVLSNMCIYGRDRVQVAAGAEAVVTSYVSSLSIDNIQFGGAVPANIELGELDMWPEGAMNVAALIDGLENGTLLPANIDPLNITSGETTTDPDVYVYDEFGNIVVPEGELTPDITNDPNVTVIVVEGTNFDLNTAQPDTVYIFGGNTIFKGGDVSVERITLAVRGNAHFAPGTILRNGAVGANGAPVIPILVTGTVHFANGSGLEHGMLVAGEDIFFASDTALFSGAIEAGGLVHTASGFTGMNEDLDFPPYANIEADPILVE